MLTGLYPNQHHAQRFRDKLEVAIPTISEELERTGYRTGAFSGSFFFTPRQGLGRGFNEFGDFSFSPAQAFTQVYYVYSIIRHLGMAEWVEENIGHPSAPRITDSVMDWIDQGHQPFFFDGELF
jgi:arylsulfatase A-like enzyme